MQRDIFFRLSVFVLLFLLVISACKRNQAETIHNPVPFLTGRTWLADTILPAPPLLYSQLSSTEQQHLVTSNSFFKMASMQLKENGTVITGNWDFGFTRWRLINNEIDLEMEKNDGTKMTLRNWQATAIRFNYTVSMGTYDVNYFFK